MEPQQLIADLKTFGLTQAAISERLRAMGHTISQSTISRIESGEVANPGHLTVKALTALRDALGASAGADRAAHEPAHPL